MSPAFVIAAKDLLQRLRDRSAFIMGIVAPLGLVLVLDATLGSAVETTKLQFGVANLDQGALGQSFEEVLAEIEGDDLADITRFESKQAIADAVADTAIDAGYVVPSDFSTATQELYLRGDVQPATITVIGDPGSPISVSVAQAVASSFANEVDYVTVAVATITDIDRDRGIGPDESGAIAIAAVGRDRPITLVPAEVEGRGFDTGSYYAISLSIFFLFFTVQFGVLSLLEERENGTLARLAASPIPAATILLGKVLAAFVVGVVSMTTMVASTTILMGATWGDPLSVAVMIVVGVTVAIALSALVGSVAKTAEQAGAYTSMTAVVLGLLGGAFFPVTSGPAALQTLSYLSPHRWLLDGFRDISFGATITDIVPTLLALLAFILVAGGIGLAGSKRGLVDR